MLKKQINRLIKYYSKLLSLDLNYFLKGGFWIILSTILTTIGGIFLSSLFSRIWPPDVYGQFSFLMSALGFISLTALPGMGQVVIQATAQNKDGVYKDAIKTTIVWSTFGGIILFSGAIYFYIRNNPNLAWATFFSALAFPISSGFALYNSFLNGKKRFKELAFYTLISQYASIITTAFALWKFPSLIIISFFSAWSTAIINICLTLMSFKYIKNNLTSKDFIKLGKHLSVSQIFTISADYLDRFLIPILLGFSNNAIYAFAILIPNQIHNIFKISLPLIQPKISQISNRVLFQQIIKKSILFECFTLVVVIFYIFLAPFVFHILYPMYPSAVRYSQFFSLSLLYFPSNLFGFGLIKIKRIKGIYISNILYAFSMLFFLIVLVPLYGINGAVISKVISRLVSFCILVYFLSKKN